MEKEVILFYLKSIKDKLKFMINETDVIKNEVLLYIEKIIDILNMLSEKYLDNTEDTKKTFEQIQSTILLNDYASALEFTLIKMKELDDRKSN